MMNKIKPSLISDKSEESSRSVINLSSLIDDQENAREALNELRKSSCTFPGGDPFFDELLAAGVRAACERGAKLEVVDLLYFAGAGRTACVKTLLSAGAPVKEINSSDWIDSGVGGGPIRFYPRLTEMKNNFGPWSDAWKACARAMSEAGLILKPSKEDVPLMHQLSSRNGADHFEFAVSLGVDVNEQNDRGESVLMTVAKQRNLVNMERLLALGADPFLRDKKGREARDYAKDSDVESRVWAGQSSSVAVFDQALSRWEKSELKQCTKAGSLGPASPRL